MPKIFKAPKFTVEQIELMPDNDPRLCSPYNDEDMEYDGLKRQYIPTSTLFQKHGINFDLENVDNPSLRNSELEHISDQIYTYIEKNSGSDVETLKCIIAHHYKLHMSPFRFRETLKEVFVKQAKFYQANGDYSNVASVDVSTKQWVDKSIMNDDRHIDPKVKVLLMGLGLSWNGSYDNQFCFMRQRGDW